MTTRSRKRKAAAELVSGFEASVAESSQTENLKAGPRKSLKIQAEKLDEIKTSPIFKIRRYHQTMSDLTKILARNQKELFKLIAPNVKISTIPQKLADSNSETENTHTASTSTPIKSKATTSKNTPISSSNIRVILELHYDT